MIWQLNWNDGGLDSLEQTEREFGFGNDDAKEI